MNLLKRLFTTGLLLLSGMGGALAQNPPSYYNGLYFDAGPTVPTRCTPPAFFYQSTSATHYACGNDSTFHAQTNQPVSVTSPPYNAKGNGVADDTAAIQAALTALATTGGVVLLPPGTYNVTSALHVPSKVTLQGSGESNTTIFIPANTLKANASWQITGVPFNYGVICFDPGTTYQRLKDLTIDANGSNQGSWFYYTEVYGYNTTNVIVDRVTVKNHISVGGTGTTFTFIGHSPLSANANNVISNSSSYGVSGCTVPAGYGAFYIEGEGNRIISSYAKDFCDCPYVLSNCDHCLIDDSVADLGGGQMSTATFSIEGARYSTISNVQCEGTGTNAHRYCVGVSSINNATGNVISTGNKIINASSSHVQTMLEIGANNADFSSTDANKDTEVIGLYAVNASLDCVLLQGYIDGLKIIGGSLTNCGGIGIDAASTGAGLVLKNIVIDGLRIDHANPRGILIFNSTTGPTITGLTVHNSWIGDSSGSPVQGYGILIAPGAATNIDISHNIFVGNTAGGLYLQGSLVRAIVGPNMTDQADNLIVGSGIGAPVTAAGTITPTGDTFHITGTTGIATINTTGILSNSYTGCIHIIPDAAFTTSLAGNIALASTAVVNKVLTMCYEQGANAGAGKWYPSY